MAPAPEWGPVFRQLSDIVSSCGPLPGFARWREQWKDLEVRRCGSTVTGLYVPGQSDLDLVLYFRGWDVQRPEQLSLLHALQKELQENHASTVHRVNLIEAKAPIVQFTMRGLVVDVSVQSVLGLANSCLIARYCKASPHLRLLARKVKEFATAWNIKSGKDGTLSSYGYTLLCAHFLQNAPLTGVDLPVLPVFPQNSDALRLTLEEVEVENADPNTGASHIAKMNGWDIPPPPRDPYLTMPQLARAVQWLPAAPEVSTMPEIETRHVVVLFAHFAAWLLTILQSGLSEDSVPYVVSIRGTEQEAAWRRIAPRLDRKAFLVIEEPFSGDNVARPLTYQGALKMQNALQKAIEQLEAHPLARSLGVSAQLLESARAARAAEYAREQELPPEALEAMHRGYFLDPHAALEQYHAYVGAH